MSKLLSRMKELFFSNLKLTLSIIGIILLPVIVIKLPDLHRRYLVSKVGSQIVKLTPLDNARTGGTGFAIVTKTGNKYTLTNAHVCRLATTDKMSASLPGADRAVVLRILEISKDADLCLLEAIPNLSGVELAANLKQGDEIGIIGHPKLQFLTLSRGYVTNFENIPVGIAFNISDEQCTEYGGSNIFALFFTVCVRTYYAGRTTAVVYGGNSGSPVVNFFGKAVGVLFAGDGETHYGYIVPLSDVNNFLSIY